MRLVIGVALTCVAVGFVLGWILAQRFREVEPSGIEVLPPEDLDISDEVEQEIEALSIWLARREGRTGAEPLFASKLRLAYQLRDLPRERRENA